jgi:hypothetical protein
LHSEGLGCRDLCEELGTHPLDVPGPEAPLEDLAPGQTASAVLSARPHAVHAVKAPAVSNVGPQQRPQQQQPVRRALRPHDGRTAIFVAGSPTLHKFIVSRLAERTDIWIAQPLSARTYAQGTVFRMKPDVTIVDVDPIWNPAGLPLARAVTEACPEAHVIVVAPPGYPQSAMIAAAAVEPGWSTVLRRKADNGERILQVIVAGLGGGNWIDPDMKGPEPGQSNSAGDGSDDGGREWEEGEAEGQSGGTDGSAGGGDVANADVEEWQKRARSGMG